MLSLTVILVIFYVLSVLSSNCYQGVMLSVNVNTSYLTVITCLLVNVNTSYHTVITSLSNYNSLCVRC